MNLLLPCIYTGARTVWRRKDGKPALSESALRSVLSGEALKRALEAGAGVTCDPVAEDHGRVKR